MPISSAAFSSSLLLLNDWILEVTGLCMRSFGRPRGVAGYNKDGDTGIKLRLTVVMKALASAAHCKKIQAILTSTFDPYTPLSMLLQLHKGKERVIPRWALKVRPMHHDKVADYCPDSKYRLNQAEPVGRQYLLSLARFRTLLQGRRVRKLAATKVGRIRSSNSLMNCRCSSAERPCKSNQCFLFTFILIHYLSNFTLHPLTKHRGKKRFPWQQQFVGLSFVFTEEAVTYCSNIQVVLIHHETLKQGK